MTEEFYDFIAYGMTRTGKLNFETKFHAVLNESHATLFYVQPESSFRYTKKLCLSKIC